MTQVDFHFIAPDGAPIANGQVEVRLAGEAFLDVESGVVVPRILRETTDGDGKLSLDLWPVTTADYTVTALDPASGRRARYSFFVPDSTTAVRMQDIVMSPAPTPKAYDVASIDAIQANRVLAQDARDTAEATVQAAESIRDYADTAATAAGTARDTTLVARDATLGYRDTAQGAASTAQADATSAGSDATAAGVARDAAQTAETNASGHATSAETAAADALAIYGTTAAVDQAILDAQTAETNAAASAVEAGNHATATEAARSTTDGYMAATLGYRNAAQSAALSADGYAEDALTAYSATIVARDATQIDRGRATQAAAKAEGTLSTATFRVDGWMDRIDASEQVLIDSRQAAETAETSAGQSASDARTATDDALAIYGSITAVQDAADGAQAERLLAEQVRAETQTARDAAQTAAGDAQFAATSAGDDATHVDQQRGVIDGIETQLSAKHADVITRSDQIDVQYTEILSTGDTVAQQASDFDTAVKATMANLLSTSAMEQRVRLMIEETS